MKILHITNDYSGSKVYMNLIRELDNYNTQQCVYHPIRSDSNFKKNAISFKTDGSEIIYSKSINKTTDRLFYRRKVRKILLDIEAKVDLSGINLIHAHTWYSDGGVAYLLSKKYNIPYIITIRNTDINVFYKYLIFQRSFGKKILYSASKIITISKIYKDKLSTISYLKEIVENKVNTIPNAVDSFWIDHAIPKKKEFKPRLIYVGSFNNGKNVVNLILSVLFLRKKGYSIELNLVGAGKGAEQRKVEKLAKLHCSTIKYHGKVLDKRILQKHYQSNYIFAMPSKYETFGLVYIEALLQGLPILYTRGEGVDGYFDNSIGEKVDSFDKFEIAEKIEKMINNYDNYIIDSEKICKQHDWRYIAKQYVEIYKKYTKISQKQ